MSILLGAPVFMEGDRSAGPAEPHGSASTDYAALAARHVAKGYAAGYAPKPDPADQHAVRAARTAFEEAGVRIGEVGCWTNLLTADTRAREANFEQMQTALRLADELGAVCAITTIGSLCTEGVDHHDPYNYSDEALRTTVDTIRRLIDSVRPREAKLTIEALPFDFTDSPTGIRRLVDAVERPEFAVHVDLVNWLIGSPRRYWQQSELLGEITEELAPWIVAAHCKDLKMQAGYDQVIVEVPLGEGQLDLRSYLRMLDSLGQEVTLLLEHLPGESAYDAATAIVRTEARAAGITLREPTDVASRDRLEA